MFVLIYIMYLSLLLKIIKGLSWSAQKKKKKKT